MEFKHGADIIKVQEEGDNKSIAVVIDDNEVPLIDIQFSDNQFVKFTDQEKRDMMNALLVQFDKLCIEYRDRANS